MATIKISASFPHGMNASGSASLLTSAASGQRGCQEVSSAWSSESICQKDRRFANMKYILY